MKTTTTLTTFSALLALASAAPSPAHQKRDICTVFGIPYWCPDNGDGATTTAAPAPVPTDPAPTDPAPTDAPAPEPTGGNGGGSTGGSSGYTRGSTADDITSDTGCTPLTVIFARGTSEGGNIGSVIGAPMFQALIADLGADQLTLQGVDYPANSAGNANCGAAGGGDMADKVSTMRGRCPDTQIVLSGYSQGACVVHNAVGSQGASGIAAAVVFGDPFNGQDFDGISNVLNVCRSDDGICNRGPSSGSGGHLSYGSSAQQAATFIEGLI